MKVQIYEMEPAQAHVTLWNAYAVSHRYILHGMQDVLEVSWNGAAAQPLGYKVVVTAKSTGPDVTRGEFQHLPPAYEINKASILTAKCGQSGQRAISNLLAFARRHDNVPFLVFDIQEIGDTDDRKPPFSAHDILSALWETRRLELCVPSDLSVTVQQFNNPYSNPNSGSAERDLYTYRTKRGTYRQLGSDPKQARDFLQVLFDNFLEFRIRYQRLHLDFVDEEYRDYEYPDGDRLPPPARELAKRTQLGMFLRQLGLAEAPQPAASEERTADG